jgi:outer membrane murein-binding lipoprotein Lpp
MEGGEAGAEIERLEARIEALAESLENCRRMILAARVAVALGVGWFAALAVGIVRFEPIAIIGIIALVLGGIVLLGSNRSTANELTAAIATAQARRAQLISEMDLRLVSDLPA